MEIHKVWIFAGFLPQSIGDQEAKNPEQVLSIPPEF